MSPTRLHHPLHRKNFSLKEQYVKSWKFIKESKKFIYFVIALFFLFALIGYFVPVPDYISNLISSYVKEIAHETANLSWAQLIFFIFFNNLKSSFFGMIFGIFLGILPSFIAIFNGYVLGFVSAASVKTNGFFVLWKLLPHGIFELPAVFISLGLGIELVGKLFERKRFKEIFIDALRVFLFVVVPLLIIAAIIEGTLIILLR